MRSRLLVLGMMIMCMVIAVFSGDINDAEQAALKAKHEQQHATLKALNPDAYLEELKALGQDEEWLAALEKLRPVKYGAELARQEERAREEAASNAKHERQTRVNNLPFNTAERIPRHGPSCS